MFTLLSHGYCYGPEYMGINDILLVYGRIHRIEKEIPDNYPESINIIDCSGKIICPGFIDQHIHITGGGGEQGPASEIPGIMLSDVISAGVTTIVGVLGVDGITRSIAGLLSKACALQQEGLNTFIYTGNYSVPTVTLTGKAAQDIIFIDKVVGVGEIAISDYRSSCPSTRDLLQLASEVLKGGMIGGKPGIMHMHVGDGKRGLEPLFDLLDASDLPLKMFVPTHLNRNMRVFVQAVEYAGKGGFTDLTAGEKTDVGYSVPDAIERMLVSGIDSDNITVSSDGNGSRPPISGEDYGVCKVGQLFSDIRSCIVDKNIDIETALKTVTSNVARILRIYPRKGSLSVGSDADILVINRKDFNIDKVFIGGELFVDGGTVQKRGNFDISDRTMNTGF